MSTNFNFSWYDLTDDESPSAYIQEDAMIDKTCLLCHKHIDNDSDYTRTYVFENAQEDVYFHYSCLDNLREDIAAEQKQQEEQLEKDMIRMSDPTIWQREKEAFAAAAGLCSICHQLMAVAELITYDEPDGYAYHTHFVCAAKVEEANINRANFEASLPRIKPEDWQMPIEELLAIDNGIIRTFRTTEVDHKGEFNTYPGANYSAQDFDVAVGYSLNPVAQDELEYVGRPIVCVEVHTTKVFHLSDPINVRKIVAFGWARGDYAMYGADEYLRHYNHILLRGMGDYYKELRQWLLDQGYDCVVQSNGVRYSTPYIAALRPEIVHYVGIAKERVIFTDEQRRVYQERED